MLKHENNMKLAWLEIAKSEENHVFYNENAIPQEALNGNLTTVRHFFLKPSIPLGLYLTKSSPNSQIWPKQEDGPPWMTPYGDLAPKLCQNDAKSSRFDQKNVSTCRPCDPYWID